MTNLTPSFVREGNLVLAVFEDEVIAKGESFAAVEGDAVKYLESLSQDRKNTEDANKKKAATHIVTPNGLKGEILGRQTGVWGEKEITVRFENGRIAKLQTHAGNDDHIKYTTEKVASESFEDYFQKVLAESPSGTKESLSKRIDDLDDLKVKVSAVIKNASYTEADRLNTIVLTADNERLEVKQALEYLEQSDAESFTPPAAFDYGVAEQADLGRGAGNSWIDHTYNSMVAESADTDFDAFLDEGPAQFTSDLDTGALADTGVTREMALAHVASKTAGYSGEEVDSYHDKFLANVEVARRAELAARQENVREATVEKESSTDDLPDESLFL